MQSLYPIYKPGKNKENRRMKDITTDINLLMNDISSLYTLDLGV